MQEKSWIEIVCDADLRNKIADVYPKFVSNLFNGFLLDHAIREHEESGEK